MMLLGNPYSVREGVVYWRQKPIAKADAASFRHLGGLWGRDAARVFVAGRVKTVDAASFQYLNPVYAKDAIAAYDSSGPIKGADAESFAVLDPGVHVNRDIVPMISARGYARDRNAVFYHDQGFGRATVLRRADPESFVSLRIDYGYDSRAVWFQKSRLPEADPASWVHLGDLWSADRERVYYAEREVPGVNRENFTIVAAPGLTLYATDCEQFFMAEHRITEQEFWTAVSDACQSCERQFRGAYHRLRGSCSTCDGSGGCFCVRNGLDVSGCARCNGTGQCHVCQGLGRGPRLREF